MVFRICSFARKNKELFQKIFFFNFEAKHTKGLKPFRAHLGYRNLTGGGAFILLRKKFGGTAIFSAPHFFKNPFS